MTAAVSGWIPILVIGSGGALGAISRYGVSLIVNRWATQLGWTFPLGTWVVNVLGSLLFGFLFVITLKSVPFSEPVKLFVFTGFLGAFTTFSTFSYETVTLMQSGHWMTAVASIMGNVLGCLLAFYLAFRLGGL